MRHQYRLPFDIPELPYEEAVRIAADTGRVPGDAGPLLETVVDMLDELGRPDRAYDCLQIAGTNGKTSTSYFTDAILRGEGLSCALYTSPHLVHYEERIQIGGRDVSEEEFAHGVSAAAEAGRRVNERRSAAGQPTYTITPFDLLTVAALVLYAEAGIDVAVLEVGMGGRWDATSAADNMAVAITGIGLDHMRILGDTLEKIAVEKAQVIKPGRIVVLGEGTHEPSVQRVMDARCRECEVVPQVVTHTVLTEPQALGNPTEFSVTTPRAIYTPRMVCATYQPQNVACAIHLAEAYLDRPLDAGRLQESLEGARTPGRFDVLRREPFLMTDCCLNPQSCEEFVASFDAVCADGCERPVLLTAGLADKDVAGNMRALVPAFPRVAVTQTDSERALPAGQLADIVRAELAREGRPESDLIFVAPSVSEALDRLTEAGEGCVAAGTITLAGETAAYVRHEKRQGR